MSIPLSLAESISDFMLNTSWTTDGLVNNNILVSTKSKRDRKKAKLPLFKQLVSSIEIYLRKAFIVTPLF